jgi:hypothetical protein
MDGFDPVARTAPLTCVLHTHRFNTYPNVCYGLYLISPSTIDGRYITVFHPESVTTASDAVMFRRRYPFNHVGRPLRTADHV